MKKISACFLVFVFASYSASSQPDNSLLYRISGKNLKKPSYLFGTIHMLCADDIQVSDSLKGAIRASDKVYLELDMDNMFEMMQAMQKMKMRNDTTFADLMSAAEYEKVKAYFTGKQSLIPFSMLETYKPMLAASMIMQTSIDCENAISMEQLIMEQAKKEDKDVNGMETMTYQLSIFDSIPYKLQAKQLVDFIGEISKGNKASKDFEEMTLAYRNQELVKLEQLINKEEFGIANFTDLLLYNRNRNWVKKMIEILPAQSIVVAVGAGHLPGEKGVINLLRKAGYKVQAVENKMIKNGKVL